jgi:hypothetical protein
LVAKKKMPAYEAFGNELSPAVSFLQAAALLDLCAELALEVKDIETISGLAIIWMQLGDRLMGPPQGSEKEDDDEPTELGSEPRQPVGFASANTMKEIEVEEDE